MFSKDEKGDYHKICERCGNPVHFEIDEILVNNSKECTNSHIIILDEEDVRSYEEKILIENNKRKYPYTL